MNRTQQHPLKGISRRKAWRSIGSAEDTLKPTDRLILALLFAFLTTDVFGGALRYYLTMMGAPWLIYVPKILIVVAYLGLAIKTAYTARIGRSLLVALVLFATFLVVGAWYTQNWVQPLFGIYVFLPLLFAILAEPALSRFGDRLVSYAAVLWLCAAFGVLYDYLIDPPWAGLTYQLGNVEIEGSRSWTTFGIERIAGFSRASYVVAGQLLFLALPWVILGRRKSLALVIWIITGGLIVLTTSKKSVGVYLFFTLLLPFMNTSLVSRQLKRVVAVAYPVLMVLIGVALPVSTLFVNYGLDLNSFVSRLLFTSFEARLTWAWPEGFSLIFDHGSTLLGRGIGGIGSAQRYFEPTIYTFADNLYLYLYATFGIVALPLIGLYTVKICRLDPYKGQWARLMWFWSVAVLMNGWAANGVEGAFTSCLLGLTLAYVHRRRAMMSFRRKIVSPHNGPIRARLYTHYAASSGNRFT